MKIRPSIKSELAEILNIHTQAFGKDEGPVIAKLVNDLFTDETAQPIVSLLAVLNEKPVGHILYSKAVINDSQKALSASILAPLAVLPEEQNKGIGEKLILEGLRILKQSGTDLVFVLGHPSYYPRCGFIPAGAQGFDAPYPIPEEHAEAWMVQELSSGILSNSSGTVQCSKVLNEEQHWRE